MKDYMLVGGPFNGKRLSLPTDMPEHFVGDIGRGIRHRYVKAVVNSTEGAEEVFLLDSIPSEAAAAALVEAKSVRHT